MEWVEHEWVILFDIQLKRLAMFKYIHLEHYFVWSWLIKTFWLQRNVNLYVLCTMFLQKSRVYFVSLRIGFVTSLKWPQKIFVNNRPLYSAMQASNISQVNTGDIKPCQKCVIHRTHWEHWSNGSGIQRAVCTFANRACGCAQYGVRDTCSLWDGVEAPRRLATSIGQYTLFCSRNNGWGATP